MEFRWASHYVTFRAPAAWRISAGNSIRIATLRALSAVVVTSLVVLASACHHHVHRQSSPQVSVEPFGFQISSGENHYQIDGYFARSPEPGKLPGLLVLNGDGGNARQCIGRMLRFVPLGIRVACISLPGYGKSTGPSRLVGPQSVEAARRGLDLLAARPAVDPSKLAVWGIGDGAVAAGLVMDSGGRAHTVILESGTYDMLKLWPQAPIGTKLSMLRQVWPSKRLLKERSVIENLPNKLDCKVLILHGNQDRKSPISQAQQLAQQLTQRGAQVETKFFPQGTHELGHQADSPVRDFLAANLLSIPASNS